LRRSRRCNDGSVAGVPLSVDGQVLLVHNRTRPRPYRPQGLTIGPAGRASQQEHGPGYDPGEGDAPGVVAFSDGGAVPDGAGQSGGPVPAPHRPPGSGGEAAPANDRGEVPE
jgi:hypothetical protein